MITLNHIAHQKIKYQSILNELYQKGYHCFYITFYQDYVIIHDLTYFFKHFDSVEQLEPFLADTYYRPATSHGFGDTSYKEVKCKFLHTSNMWNCHYKLDKVYHLDSKTINELNKIFS